MGLFETVAAGIKPADEAAKKAAFKRQDQLAKPLGSLGSLEDISIKVAGITGKVINEMQKKAVIIMCSDNGVYEEGVSACPQDVTRIQAINFIRGITGVGVLSRFEGTDLKVIDVGINAEVDFPGLINKKIRKSTSNMAKGPAMSREEAIKALEIGIGAVGDLVKEGYSLLGTGEMGIANTSTSSAVVMCLTGCSVDVAVGKGAGLTEEGYANKKRVIERAIEINRPDAKDPVDVLTKVGGFDIAGIAGCYLGAAYYRVPIVIDGFISAAAALLACRINPSVRDYIFPSHCSEEPGYKIIMEELQLEPILNLHMRLGEGSGCPLAFNIIEAAEAVIGRMVTFAEAEIVNEGTAYKR